MPEFSEFKPELIDEYYSGNHTKYYEPKYAFFSMLMCCRIKKSYGFIKDAMEKLRRFKKDVKAFEKETDIVKIISGMRNFTDK